MKLIFDEQWLEGSLKTFLENILDTNERDEM